MSARTPLNLATKKHAFEAAVEDLLSLAKERKASDLHFEPRGENGGGEVRFRLSGRLVTLRTFENPTHWDDVLKELKRRAGLAFKTGFAQDARFTSETMASDYRVSLIPVCLGVRDAERIVLRVIPRSTTFSLETLGLPQSAVDAFRAALARDKGLVIVTGPTGSGKSVTLASGIREIDREANSVLTLEDPVESLIAGVAQAQVTATFTFADGLRAFLRQDPDYILVGETRDSETAKILLQAADTGHVVLTTLHTNSAREAFRRLAALGVDEELARECVTFVCAQRLPSRLCAHCTEEDVEHAALARRTFPELPLTFIPMRSRGCSLCHGTGLSGRVLLFEYIAPVRNSAGKTELVAFGSLRESARSALEKGEIDALEAFTYA